MLCCAVGVAAVATKAIGWRRFRRFLCGTLHAQSALTAAAVAMIVVTISGFGMVHIRHHAAHASDSIAAIPTDALPLCRGGPVADRSIDTAGNEE
jgi:hypothetical protein